MTLKKIKVMKDKEDKISKTSRVMKLFQTVIYSCLKKINICNEENLDLSTIIKNSGYLPINTSVNVLIPPKGRNVSLLMMISNRKILHSQLIIGAYNSNLFNFFLEEYFSSNRYQTTI